MDKKVKHSVEYVIFQSFSISLAKHDNGRGKERTFWNAKRTFQNVKRTF